MREAFLSTKSVAVLARLQDRVGGVSAEVSLYPFVRR